MTASLDISGPPIDAMTGWHGIMVSPAGLHAEVRVKIDKTDFVFPMCPDTIFSTMPVHTGQIMPNRKLLRLRKDSDIDIQLQLNSSLKPDEKPHLTLPDGWTFELAAGESNNKQRGRVSVPSSARQGHYTIGAKVLEQEVFRTQSLAYPHIRPQTRFAKVSAEIALVDTAGLDGLRVGWIDGGVDEAHHWADQLGARIIQLDDDRMISGDFEGLDVIVAGVFAGATRPLNSSMKYIRPWIESGGHFVSQYHRPIDNWDKTQSAPLLLQPGSPSIRWRVTDAAAPVSVLQPDHPLLKSPNRIISEDFNGWVKERGLYFASEWDPAYIPLFSMSDNGEAPLEGGLLAAQIGAGSHVHCALNLFYQMDHIVAGAFRLFANLLTPSASK